MAQATIPARSEVPREHTWNAESVFASKDLWETACQELVEKLGRLRRFQGHLSDGPTVLLEWMATYDQLMIDTNCIAVYGFLAAAVDTTDQAAAAMSDRAMSLIGQTDAAMAFASPEILEIGQETISAWLEGSPALAVYAHYFDNLFRQQAHVRSAEVETLLGLVGDPFSAAANTANLLINADMRFEAATHKGEPVPVISSNIDDLLNRRDRELRRTAWQNYADGHLKFKNTLANNLAFAVKRDVFFMRARGYDSSLQAALFENNIPIEVFYNLIETFKRHLPTWHRYWAVRKRALSVDRLHPYDIWAPLADKVEVGYEEAVDWISEGLMPLGADYVEALRRGCLQDRWVDIYPNLGKQQGAFSAGGPGAFPFIMMSYGGNLESMSTLAHELGHSMHSYLSSQAQPPTYAQYSLFVAEVASNFNQALTRAYLFKTMPDRNFQIALIEEAMSNFHRYFFIMPTLARFELALHEQVERGEGLTADALIDLMADLYEEGYGGEMEIDRERIGITWAQFQHLYSNFYVYQYATGISAAQALAHKVLTEEDNAVENYLSFLKTGNSLYPLEALDLAGVDMTTPEPVEEAFQVMSEMIDRLERLTTG